MRVFKNFTLLILLFSLAACSASSGSASATTVWSKDETRLSSVAYDSSGTQLAQSVTAPGPRKTGKPYVIKGVTYYPLQSVDHGYQEVGVASWYGKDFHNKKTANGEIYNMHDLTAAHKTLPMPTFVKVENLENGKEVIVRVNDRGPFSKGRIIDLSYAAAQKLDMVKTGTAKVRITVLSETKDHLRTEGKDVDMAKGAFSIQIIAYSNRSNAQKLASQYKGGVVNTVNRDGRIFYQVRVRGFNTKTSAEAALKQFQRDYPDAFIISE